MHSIWSFFASTAGTIIAFLYNVLSSYATSQLLHSVGKLLLSIPISELQSWMAVGHTLKEQN